MKTNNFHALGVLRVALDAGIPAILWGLDGEGKSAAIRAIAAERGSGFGVANASNLDPTDLGGIPFVDAAGKAARVPLLKIIREAVESAERGEEYILFLDEMNTGAPAVIASILTLMSEWVAGDVQLDSSLVKIVAAANPPDIAVDGQDFQPPTCTRMLHIDWSLPYEYWADGVRYGGWTDPALAAETADILAFLEYGCAPGAHRENKFRVTPSASHLNKPRPNPRTWTNLARALHSARKGNVPAAVERRVVQGIIGEGVGAEFCAFLKLKNELPDMDAIFKGEYFEFPERGDLRYLFFSTLAARVETDPTVANWKRAWEIIGSTEGTELLDTAAIGARNLAKFMGSKAGRHLARHRPVEAGIFVDIFRSIGRL